MRELEFLPNWYPKVRQRRRWMMLQGWLSLAVVAAMGLWMYQANRNIAGFRREAAALEREATESQERARRLDDLMELQKQLRLQDQVMGKMGLHVESTRLINAIDDAMSPEMSLLEIAVEVNESQRRPKTLVLAGAGNVKQEPLTDRRLAVRVQGVASSDVDVATFFEKLGGNALFQNVNLNYARPRISDGHVMREFEVSFSINLNTSEG